MSLSTLRFYRKKKKKGWWKPCYLEGSPKEIPFYNWRTCKWSWHTQWWEHRHLWCHIANPAEGAAPGIARSMQCLYSYREHFLLDTSEHWCWISQNDHGNKDRQPIFPNTVIKKSTEPQCRLCKNNDVTFKVICSLS